MDITANKQDKIYRPDSVYTLNAGEMNQIISEIMTAITSAGINPSSADTGQLREAILARISAHNTDGEAHADIRQAIEDFDLTEYLKKTEASSTYTPLEGGNMGKPLSAYNYVNNTVYYYWNKLFNIADIKVNNWAIFLIAAKNDYNSVVSFSHLLYVSRYNSAGSYSVLLSPLVSFNTTADGNTKIYVAADGDNNIYVQARATWVGPDAFKIIKIVGDVNFTPENAGYTLLGEDPENFTSLAKIEDSGAFKVSLADNNVLNFPASYNVLKLTSQYAISDKNGNNIDTTYIKNTTKGVSGGVASLGSDGKIPQEQLPSVIAPAVPVYDLGTVSEAEFETNTNYTLSINANASFTLPYPSVYSVTNKITLNLNVLANSVISWGANVNAALAEFTPGKYQIRLLWNNTSSAWSAEVLKETAAVGDTVVLCHFDGNCSNEAGGAVINQLADANGVTWEELTPGFGLAAKNAMKAQGALFQFDAHESLVLPGDFTIEFTVKNPCAGQNGEYTMDFTDKIVYETLSATSERHGIQCHGNAAIAFGGKFLKSSEYNGSTDKKNVAVVRSGDTLYYYENGSLVMSGTGWQGLTLDLRGWYMVGMAAGDKAGMVIDELRISRSAKYLTNYTPATSPFVLADSGVSDLHDIKMAELYSSISALQNELQILKGQTMKRLDYTNAVEFYLKENGQTSYTVPANGYILGYGYQTYKSGSNTYQGSVLINGINVGIYFRKYTLGDVVNTSVPLSMPLSVSTGDVITITGNREAFQEPYLFIPEKEDWAIGA